MFCVETVSMSAGPDWLDRPGRRRLRRCISAGGAAAEHPGDARCTFSKHLFVLFDINVLRLRLATAESTDYFNNSNIKLSLQSIE